jgi:hypothetical protein
MHKVGMQKCKPVRTPLAVLGKISISSGKALTDEVATKYRGIVGLQYLILTRSDISFAVNKVCQFLHAPTDLHLSAMKQILRYV